MSISKRVRFEVFKRDDFTCAYCGRKVPEVTLEVDHIVPRVEGGGDEIENLTAACEDCNRGKSGIPLDNKTALVDLNARAERLQERERQVRAYEAAVRARRNRIDLSVQEVENYWAVSYGGWERLGHYHLLNPSILRRYLEILGLHELLEAVDITVAKYRYPAAAATRYYGGVLRQKARNLSEGVD